MNRTASWLVAFRIGAVLSLLAFSRLDAAVESGPVETTAFKGRTPVETFRKVLDMSPEERTRFLTNYPTAARERILAKVQEYQMLPGPYRELRLRTTELRWYLLPLLKMSGAARQEALKKIPETYQKLVAVRLEEWDLWPPGLKEQVLEYEEMMNRFVGWGAPPPPADVPGKKPSEAERKLARWHALPEGQREQMFASFKHYFELSEDEKQRTLDALSEPERQETEKVLDPMEKWGKPQQQKYMAAFQQFTRMSTDEQQHFLSNADRWRKMSETERQAWRDLIRQGSSAGARLDNAGATAPAKTNPTAAPVK